MPQDSSSGSRSASEGSSEKEPQAEKAYRALKRLILENELPPGAQLLEQEAALKLGMSRTPVREAMVRLQQEGMVEIRPRHGMRVLPVSIDDMREIYDILTALEALAAGRAAGHGLSDRQLSELDAAVDAMDTALAGDDLNGWATADTRFHSLLVAASGNQRLQATIAMVLDQSERARRLTLGLRPKPVDSNNDHRAVVAAIRARDTEAAYRIHRQHREKNGRMLIELLSRLNLRLI
ncbi:MAG: GntR family transcriptional regulator [Beijerinckiaceae bacterium]